jgi:hypothetical protein
VTSKSIYSRISRACRITRFLLHIGVADHANVGRVAGWVESAYSLGVLTGLAPASYLSDTIGRKKTAISRVLGASIPTILFGFGKTSTTCRITIHEWLVRCISSSVSQTPSIYIYQVSTEAELPPYKQHCCDKFGRINYSRKTAFGVRNQFICLDSWIFHGTSHRRLSC